MRRDSILGLGLLLVICLACPAQDASQKSRDNTRFVIDGVVRGMTIPALVVKQHEKALANWKGLFAAETPASSETTHFLLYGAPGRSLKEAGLTLERQFAQAVKALDMEHDEPWSGKLAIYLWADRGNYTSFVRTAQKRRAEEDETSCRDVDGMEPHVIAGPPLLKTDLMVEGQAGMQMAAALFATKLRNAKAPEWVLEAFGRMTVVKSLPAPSLAAEHRRAYALVVQKKRTLKEVVGSGLPEEEALVLRGSFMEYLAYGTRASRLPAFTKGFQPTEGMAEPTVEAALKSANIPLEKLDSAWQSWVKSMR